MSKHDSCSGLFTALNHLSPTCRIAVNNTIEEMGLRREGITEIRLRSGRNTVISTNEKKVSCAHTVDGEELRATLRSLCMGAVYAYQNTIKNGYIPMQGGGRAGVVGVISDGNVSIAPDTVTAINIRIPHHIRGVCQRIYDLFVMNKKGIIIYSPPAVGKTTLLRDLAIELSRGSDPLNVALIDTRRELDNGRIPSDCMIDTYSGYPKSMAIEIAVRTMASDVIICDEIGYEEAEALRYTVISSIPVIAAVHAGSIDELKRRFDIRRLMSIGAFEYAVGISRDTDSSVYNFVVDKIG